MWQCDCMTCMSITDAKNSRLFPPCKINWGAMQVKNIVMSNACPIIAMASYNLLLVNYLAIKCQLSPL